MRLPVTELSEVVALMREDWHQEDIASALVAVRNAGWTEQRAVLELMRLAADDDASPRDMLAAVRDPLRRATPAPGTYTAGAAAARAALARTPGTTPHETPDERGHHAGDRRDR